MVTSFKQYLFQYVILFIIAAVNALLALIYKLSFGIGLYVHKSLLT